MKNILTSFVVLLTASLSFAIPGGDNITEATFVGTQTFIGELTPSNTASGLTASCFTSTYPDVYYKFTIADPSVSIFYNSGGNPNNLNVRCQFFTFDGTNYNEVGCHLYNSIFPGITINGQTVGETMYMRFVDFPGDQTGNVEFFLLGTLPLSLVDFEGHSLLNKNELHWIAEQASQVDYAEIERSSDAHRFEKVGQVALKNSISAETYSWTDSNPLTRAYYRLKIVDLDGSYEYSDVIVIENKKSANSIIVFPNPSTEYLSVEGLRKDETATLFSADGRILGTLSNNEQFDMNDFPSGIYFIKTEDEIQKIFKN